MQFVYEEDQWVVQPYIQFTVRVNSRYETIIISLALSNYDCDRTYITAACLFSYLFIWFVRIVCSSDEEISITCRACAADEAPATFSRKEVIKYCMLRNNLSKWVHLNDASARVWSHSWDTYTWIIKIQHLISFVKSVCSTATRYIKVFRAAAWRLLYNCKVWSLHAYVKYTSCECSFLTACCLFLTHRCTRAQYSQTMQFGARKWCLHQVPYYILWVMIPQTHK